jgi:cytochrome c peroxidase
VFTIALMTILLSGAARGAPAAAMPDQHPNVSFTLSRHCPPAFELTRSGRCKFVSLYQLYDSPEGFGGIRVPLPPEPREWTPQQIDLGRLLFFDPLLSRDRDLSCADCHDPAHAFTDGLARARGRGGIGTGPMRRGGVALPRNTPTLWNVGFLHRLYWDGRAPSLVAQAQQVLFSPDEMGGTPSTLEAALSANVIYRRLFAEAFGRPSLERIPTQLVARALAAFESSLVSFNSRYDRYALGDPSALTAAEKRGFAIFRSFTVRCSQCHTPPLFTNGQLAVIGVPNASGQPFDPGAGRFSRSAALRGAFEIPTLRNIALTAPYMNAGQFSNLQQVIAFYNGRRGHAAPPGERLQIHWDVALQGPVLGPRDISDLVAFLGTLTDESMMPLIPRRVPSGLPVAQAHEPFNGAHPQ